MTEARREAPDGYHWEWEAEDEHWRIGGQGHQCRMVEGVPRRRCPRPAVARLNRGRRAPSWWHYCEDHLYGRRIHNGRVELLRMKKDSR